MLLFPLAIIALVVVVWFSISNGFFVTVSFFATEYYQPFTIVALIIFLAGMFVGFLFMFAALIRKANAVDALKRKITSLEVELEKDRNVVYQSSGLGQEGDNLI